MTDPRQLEKPMAESHGVYYERTDVEPGVVVRAGIAIAVVTVVTAVAGFFLFFVLGERAAGPGEIVPPMAYQGPNRQAPPPRLQEQPTLDVRHLRAEEDAVLGVNGYAWVDKASGVVRIPITEAMRLVSERGLPTPGPALGAPAAAAGVPAGGGAEPGLSRDVPVKPSPAAAGGHH